MVHSLTHSPTHSFVNGRSCNCLLYLNAGPLSTRRPLPGRARRAEHVRLPAGVGARVAEGCWANEGIMLGDVTFRSWVLAHPYCKWWRQSLRCRWIGPRHNRSTRSPAHEERMFLAGICGTPFLRSCTRQPRRSGTLCDPPRSVIPPRRACTPSHPSWRCKYQMGTGCSSGRRRDQILHWETSQTFQVCTGSTLRQPRRIVHRVRSIRSERARAWASGRVSASATSSVKSSALSSVNTRA